jgi:hypothetical protein
MDTRNTQNMQWYYCEYNDILYQMGDNTVTAFICTMAYARVQPRQEYYQADDIDVLPKRCVPANIIPTRDGTIHRRSIGPPLAKTAIGTETFWTYLKSLGGELMWDNIQGGKMGVKWIRTALTDGSFIGVTDGSYDRVRAKYVSGSGWVICCTKTRHLLQGLFFETSPKAGSYRGELLGLVALHTMIAGVPQFYKVNMAIGKICCDNILALGQSSKTRKRDSTGIKHLDFHQAI